MSNEEIAQEMAEAERPAVSILEAIAWAIALVIAFVALSKMIGA